MPIRSQRLPLRRTVASEMAFLGFEFHNLGGNLSSYRRPVKGDKTHEDVIVRLDSDCAEAPTRLDQPVLFMRVNLEMERAGEGNRALSLHREFDTVREAVSRLMETDDLVAAIAKRGAR